MYFSHVLLRNSGSGRKLNLKLDYDLLVGDWLSLNLNLKSEGPAFGAVADGALQQPLAACCCGVRPRQLSLHGAALYRPGVSEPWPPSTHHAGRGASPGPSEASMGALASETASGARHAGGLAPRRGITATTRNSQVWRSISIGAKCRDLIAKHTEPVWGGKSKCAKGLRRPHILYLMVWNAKFTWLHVGLSLHGIFSPITAVHVCI